MDNSSSIVSSSGQHNLNNLNNLPDLVYCYLLKNLDLDDLCSLSLVSKRLNFFVKGQNIYELSFKKFELDYNFTRNWISFNRTRSPFNHLDFIKYSCENNWFSTCEPVRFGNQIDTNKLRRFSTNPPNILLNLKYLRISDARYQFIKLDDLNKFTKLQVLEIKHIESRLNGLLQLPDLKALAFQIDCPDYNSNSIMIDTPNLHSLFIEKHTRQSLIDDVIKFNYPQSVKHLQIYGYDKNAPIFINLECLEIFNISLIGDEIINGIMKLNNLKKLRLNECCRLGQYRLTSSRLVIYEFTNLLKSKKNDFEIFLDGVRLREIKKFSEYQNRSTGLQFQLDNYGELDDDLHFESNINYNHLVDLLPYNQPADLFTKYTNIQRLEVQFKVDESQLIHFIRRCHNLQDLDINCGTAFSQQFYDQLPEIGLLTRLRIHNFYSDFNFDFIIKIKYLEIFTTNQDVLISKQLNLNGLKRLRKFAFEINGKQIIISKDRDRYCIYDQRQSCEQFVDSHDELIKWCNQLRYKKN